MRFKYVKNADVEVSEMSVGTWAIGGQMWGEIDDTDSIDAIRSMIDNGCNLVDTAPIYADGHSEEVVGKALLDGYREKVLISTKFGVSYAPDGSVINNNSYDNILWECEQSLKRLQTDVIDIYIVHWPDPSISIEETMKALNYLKDQGKIRFIGMSNYDKAGIQEAQKYAQIDFVQLPYSMVKEDDKDLLTWCESEGMGIMTYGSLGSGILTGAIREKPNWSADDVRLTFYDYYHEPKFSKIQKLLLTMDELSEKYKAPLAQIAMNWSGAKSFVTTSIVGVRNVSEAVENSAAYTWSLEEQDVKLLDDKLDELGISDGKAMAAAKRNSK